MTELSLHEGDPLSLSGPSTPPSLAWQVLWATWSIKHLKDDHSLKNWNNIPLLLHAPVHVCAYLSKSFLCTVIALVLSWGYFDKACMLGQINLLRDIKVDILKRQFFRRLLDLINPLLLYRLKLHILHRSVKVKGLLEDGNNLWGALSHLLILNIPVPATTFPT